MKTIKNFKMYRLMSLFLAASISFVSCSEDDNAAPEEEPEMEVITDVALVFTNSADATDVVRVRAQDPDGLGAQELVILDNTITLNTDTTYELTYEILNNLDPNESEDIGADILKEDNDHQFFYSFTEDVFSSPAGNGNIDTASDPINYTDMDENGLRVGLSTTWTTPAAASTGGSFTARLKHQPGIKAASTGAEDGDSDFDLTFVLNIAVPQATIL